MPWKSHMHAYCRLNPPHGPTFRGSDGRSSSENIVSRSLGWISTFEERKIRRLLRGRLKIIVHQMSAKPPRAFTFRMMYFNGTVGNICLIAEAKSVTITSASCDTTRNKRRKKEHFR